MSTTIRFPVFRDHRGNRFIFPGLHDASEMLAGERWARCRSIEVALRVTEEDEPFSVDEDDDGVLHFPHVPAEAGSPGFAHGSGSVWIVGGPEFDAVTGEAGR